jgi:hypothetical protein
MQKHRVPTMLQISRKAAEIRQGWSQAERCRRADVAKRCFALLTLLSAARP